MAADYSFNPQSCFTGCSLGSISHTAGVMYGYLFGNKVLPVSLTQQPGKGNNSGSSLHICYLFEVQKATAFPLILNVDCWKWAQREWSNRFWKSTGGGSQEERSEHPQAVKLLEVCKNEKLLLRLLLWPLQDIKNFSLCMCWELYMLAHSHFQANNQTWKFLVIWICHFSEIFIVLVCTVIYFLLGITTATK